MKETLEPWLRPTRFTLGGALIGLGYYHFVGCAAGSCPVAANPIRSMICVGFAGWLVSVIFRKEAQGECSI